MNRKKVIIIGGGFGGINAAQALKKADVDIVLLDRMNHHVFQPLLYQVATAALAGSDIASPIREILRNQKNVIVLMENVENIDLDSQKVYSADGHVFDYDYLIVAPGARHSYFGHDQWETYAPGLKTVADGVRIREKLLLTFEKAERCNDPEEIRKLLTFVIVGAGPTGVEMAGSIAEFAHRSLINNFRYIHPETTRIYLIEGASQVLPGYPKKLADEAQKDLERLGVTVLLNTLVTDVTADGVSMRDHSLAASNVIWAAGNQASSLLKVLNAPLDRQGRVIVQPDLTIPNHPNVFVIGDAAAFKNEQGQMLPAIAPVAIQQAHYVAKIIKKHLSPNERQPFSYFDKGMVATIGRGKAVATLRKLKFSGVFAWLVWCFIHIFYLVSFRRRVLVMVQWFFLYITNRSQVRIISQSVDEKH